MLKVFLIIILAFISACERGSGDSSWSPDDENVDPISAILPFSDIPIPRNFKLDQKRSFSFQKDKKRYGKLLYTGKLSFHDLETFMKDQLEFQQWIFQSKSLRNGEISLYFTKAEEELRVNISGSDWRRNLEIIFG